MHPALVFLIGLLVGTMWGVQIKAALSMARGKVSA